MEKNFPSVNAEKMSSNEIGDSKSSFTLQYFSINKFLKKNNLGVKLYKLICNTIIIIIKNSYMFFNKNFKC